MIKVGDNIMIMPSRALFEIKLSGVVGRTGLVVEELRNIKGKISGYNVQLSELFEDELLWFIPLESVVIDE